MSTIPDNLVARLLDRDMTLWADSEPDGRPDPRQLDWLDAVAFMEHHAADIMNWAAGIRDEMPVDQVMLVGMGGSSLAAEVMYSLFRESGNGPGFSVLDTVSPTYLADLGIDFERTLFIVSSKSGTTVETADLHAWLYAEADRFHARPGQRFVAITDPGSQLERTARDQEFRQVFLNPPGIGGRFSALSHYGLVPAALYGVDLIRLREHAHRFVAAVACSPTGSPVRDLAQVMVNATRSGWGVLEIESDNFLWPLYPWIEQMVAESTGKGGLGILPVRQGQVADNHGITEPRHARTVMKRVLHDSTHVGCVMHNARQVSIGMKDPYDIGGEFLRWQMATVLTASRLGINPFDQPDVERTKSRTRKLIHSGEGSRFRKFFETGEYDLYACGQDISRNRSCDWIEALEMLSDTHRDGYLAILAYLPMWHSVEVRLTGLARVLTPLFGVVTVGFGPRYLHSTGQFHKGGPGKGCFLQVLDDRVPELDIPGREYGFRQLHRAQAEGDARVLAEIGLPVVRIMIKADRLGTLEILTSQLSESRTASRSN